jgi:hypothetical protein
MASIWMGNCYAGHWIGKNELASSGVLKKLPSRGGQKVMLPFDRAHGSE